MVIVPGRLRRGRRRTLARCRSSGSWPPESPLRASGAGRAAAESLAAADRGPAAQDFPDDPEMRVSHETIYQALYVQGRGELRRELAAYLRTGRAVRKPRRRAQAERPAAGSPAW